MYFFSRKVHFLLIFPNYQFTVEMSVRKGARAEPLIFSISQSNSQFPQSKIKSTKRSTPVLNFSKYETVLKKWDLMDCDSVTFPTHPSFPFTEPFAKLSRETWKFNNHYCLFWFPHLMSIFIKFYIFSTGQMYLWHWFILFFWCKPPLSILQFVQSLVFYAIYLQKLNCIFVLSVAKPEFGKHWLN